MIRWISHPLISVGISPRIRPARVAMLLVLSVCVLTTALPSDAAKPPLQTFELMPGLTARVTAEGSLVFGEGPSGLLKVDLAPSGDARRVRSHDDAVFGAQTREGVAGGMRGYSPSADDDRDGRVDEDPLDGQDNDGDGQIDEDFAAVGDAMVALHLTNGPAGRPIHLEYYHWAHVHLRSAVFLAATGRPDLVDAGALRVATSGSLWREVMTPGRSSAGPGHPALPGGRAYVTRVDRDDSGRDDPDCGPTGSLWLGVRALIIHGDDPINVSGSRLEVALAHASTPLVFAAAESRQQLIRILDQATAVPPGVTDPMTGRRTAWVAPPLCASCRQAQMIPMTWRAADDGSLVLAARRSDDHVGLPDPDLFILASGPLGAPDIIRWVPDDGPAFVIPWACPRLEDGPEALTRFDLPAAPGRVEYVFSGVAGSGLGEEITGRFLDGRPLRTVLTSAEDLPNIGRGIAGVHQAPNEKEVEQAAADIAAERARVLKAAEHQPTLSPALLEGWPNPFSDQIQLRYQVPRTIEEAFVWKNAEDMPTGLDLQASVPWNGGRPRVSVKIYSINGQELVTLEAADLGVGQYSVQWNGTDAFGRQVASGTYFCKLQLDEWSVTRQLVFLR